jgi:hypothetical protein
MLHLEVKNKGEKQSKVDNLKNNKKKITPNENGMYTKIIKAKICKWYLQCNY